MDFNMMLFPEIGTEWINTVRWVIGIAILGVGAYIIIENWSMAINLFFKESRAPFVPLAGSCLAVLGILIAPFENQIYWFWTPLLVDWGCIPMWIWLGMAERKRAKKHRPSKEPDKPPMQG